MKTKFTSIAAVLLLLLSILGSCNPSHPTPGAPSSYKVKTIILEPNTFGGTDTMLITYDSMGRILSCYPELYRTDCEAYYTYTGTTMTIRHNYSWPGTFQCNLNSLGLLDSVGLFDFNYSRVTSERLTYNSDGFLIQQIEPDTSAELYIKGYVTSYGWTDSCLTSMTDSVFGRASNTATYTYYTIREYRDRGLEDIASTTNYYYMMPDMALRSVLVLGSALGGHSKYLRKTKTIDGVNTTNYSYDFDVYGRVITQTETQGGNTRTYHYTYY